MQFKQIIKRIQLLQQQTIQEINSNDSDLQTVMQLQSEKDLIIDQLLNSLQNQAVQIQKLYKEKQKLAQQSQTMQKALQEQKLKSQENQAPKELFDNIHKIQNQNKGIYLILNFVSNEECEKYLKTLGRLNFKFVSKQQFLGQQQNLKRVSSHQIVDQSQIANLNEQLTEIKLQVSQVVNKYKKSEQQLSQKIRGLEQVNQKYLLQVSQLRDQIDLKVTQNLMLEQQNKTLKSKINQEKQILEPIRKENLLQEPLKKSKLMYIRR